MIPITVTIDGRAVSAALIKLSDQMAGRNLEAAATAGALVFDRAWKELFRSSSDPSIPGAPPRRQTGTYSRSIHPETLAVTRDSATVEVGTNIDSPPYPVFLEYGTSRMPAHPIARPAFEQNTAEAADTTMRALAKLLGI